VFSHAGVLTGQLQWFFMAGSQIVNVGWHIVRPIAKKKRSVFWPPASSKLDDVKSLSPPSFWRGQWPVLLVILLIGATLRLVNLAETPPGLNQDEAANAWNAYCLLKTGQDQFGVRWPIFYSRFFGENRTTLFMYVLLPFQAIGGLNVWTTRLPCAVGGVMAVLLFYYIARRLFSPTVGLVAAGLMSLNPWHIQQSRWGHEGGLTSLLVIGPVAAWLWAGLPFDDDEKKTPRAWKALVAGLVTGVSCYGYPSVRLFLPIFLGCAILVTCPAWFRQLKTRRGAAAIITFGMAFAVTFGPLVYKHLTDPAIGKRGETTWVWSPDDPPSTQIGSVLTRYIQHFGLDFLFIRGDHFNIQSPPGMGMFYWYMLPLMLLGLVAAVRHSVSSSAARILLLWVILYPVGDSLNAHPGSHAIRALSGSASLILLAAFGAVTAGTWLWRYSKMGMLAASGVLVLLIVALNIRFLGRFFNDYKRDLSIYQTYQTDLVEAGDWLRPRWDSFDAVFCSANFNQPFSILLVKLGYDPHQWFQDVRDVRPMNPSAAWDIHTRVGKMHFMYDASRIKATMKELRANNRKDHVALIVRPGEFRRLPKPAYEIHRPDGRVTLLICELEL